MQQFIGREDWLNRFKDYLSQEKGIVWRITGQPGIGKSTLLRRFEHTCEHAERPNVWLDLENFTPAQGLEVLAAMASAARFFDTEKANKGWKEKAGEGFKTVSGGLIGALELGKDLIPGGGLAVGAAKVLVGLGEGVAGNAAQISENAAANHPELYLLDALAKAGEKRPVCLIDTYEHILRNDLKIQSRLVLGYGQAREGNAKTVSLSVWLADVFEYLKDKGWRIVMTGREVPRSKSDDQLPRFSRDEILRAAHIRPALAEYLPAQEFAIASVLSTLSFEGNPLWLQVAMNLLENLLAEGKDLAQLAQQPEYLHECFETDDPFDTGAYDGIEHGRCKLTLINTLTRHIGDLEDQAWKIALPRVLDKGIVMQLFEPQQANAILHNFKLAGVFRVTGQQFTIHEEIRDLLLAYARSKGWLDTDETRALHGKLWDYLNSFYLGKLPPELRNIVSREGLYNLQTKQTQEQMQQVMRDVAHLSPENQAIALQKMQNISFIERQIQVAFNQVADELLAYIPLNWMIEACYHRIMSLVELQDKNVKPLHFWQSIRGAISLTLLQKWQIIEILPDMQAEHISLFTVVFLNELSVFQKIFGQDTTQAMLQTESVENGGILKDVEFWQKRVREYGLAGDYFGLQNALSKPLQCIKVIDEMLQRYGYSSEPIVQEQCATALFNKGVMLDEKLDDSRGAVEVYNSLLQCTGDSDLLAVREWGARALHNKGWLLGSKLNDPLGAIVVCDSLLHRFGDSNHAALQELCAKALVNKGWILGEKLNDPLGAMAVYDSLLQNFGDSTIPIVQVLCAMALRNKGVMLGEKLNNPQGAVAVYDSLRQRFGDSVIPTVQEQSVTVLVSKCVTLGRMDDLAGAIACYDDLLARYGQSENPVIRSQCQLALANMAELLLVLGKNEEAIPRIRQVLARTDATNLRFAILNFLLWLAEEADATQDDVLVAIRALSPTVEFTWVWDDIRLMLTQFPEPRKTQAECFIAFFEQHHDIAQLESCLTNCEINRSS